MPARPCIGTIVALLALGAMTPFAGADDEPANETESAAESDSKISITRGRSGDGWNASTQSRERETETGWSEGRIQFRAYDRFNRLGPALGPGIGPRGLAMGVDVAADIEQCPDGRSRIRSMNIGGIDYQLSDGCRSLAPDSQVSISRDGGSTTVETSETFTLEAAEDDGKRIQCDPKTWTCLTVPD